MPEADSFTARRGFPLCINSVDVSSYHTMAPLKLSEASMLQWNTYKLLASSSIVDPDQDPPVEIAVTDAELTSDPQSRFCGSESSWNGKSQPPSDFFNVSNYITTELSWVKMYDGDTGDENNFLGYGIDGKLAHAFAGEDGGSGFVGALSVLTSYAQFAPDDQSEDSNLWWGQFSILSNVAATPIVSSVNISGYPFVLLEWPYLYDAASSEITGLEFYTYPG